MKRFLAGIIQRTLKGKRSGGLGRRPGRPRFVPRVEGFEPRIVPAFQLLFQQAGFADLLITDNGPNDASPAVGEISFNGSYGTFEVAFGWGVSKPLTASPDQALMDFVFQVNTNNGGSLKITLGDTGFDAPPQTANPLTLFSHVDGNVRHMDGGPAPPGSSVTGQAFADVNNIQFGTGVTPGPQGPFTTAFSDDKSTTFNRLATPYSLTSVATIVLGPGGLASGDFVISVTGQPVPPPPPPPPPPPHADGRMTGGGSIFTTPGDLPGAGIRVTHGFELHCNLAIQPNRLQINIHNPARDRFHLEQMTSATCFDDPALDPENPAAPIDTYVGVGKGRFNGVSGYTINFTFTDDGEPGTSDTAKYLIWLDSNNNGVVDGGETPVLQTGPKNLTFGNHQAHEEHKKPGTTTLNFWTAHQDTKVNPTVWPPTGWTSNQRVKAAFSRAGSQPYVNLGNDSLAKSLGYAGGSDLTGAAQTLLRVGTASLLSASHIKVVYPISADEVRSRVNTALNSKDPAAILAAASDLEDLDAVKYWITEVSPQKLDGSPADAGAADALTHEQLQRFVADAVAHWRGSGLATESLGALNQFVVQIVDLPGGYLGGAAGRAIWIDQDAAGHGWFLAGPGENVPLGRVDLFTVVSHELGHLLGFDDLDSSEHANNLMAATLPVGVRRLPGVAREGSQHGSTASAAVALSHERLEAFVLPDSTRQASLEAGGRVFTSTLWPQGDFRPLTPMGSAALPNGLSRETDHRSYQVPVNQTRPEAGLLSRALPGAEGQTGREIRIGQPVQQGASSRATPYAIDPAIPPVALDAVFAAPVGSPREAFAQEALQQPSLSSSEGGGSMALLGLASLLVGAYSLPTPDRHNQQLPRLRPFRED
jgi:hypothetical protein